MRDHWCRIVVSESVAPTSASTQSPKPLFSSLFSHSNGQECTRVNQATTLLKMRVKQKKSRMNVVIMGTQPHVNENLDKQIVRQLAADIGASIRVNLRQDWVGKAKGNGTQKMVFTLSRDDLNCLKRRPKLSGKASSLIQIWPVLKRNFARKDTKNLDSNHWDYFRWE